MLEPQASVRFTRRYTAPPAEIWAALTDSGSLSRWLGRVRRGTVAPGAELELELDGKTVAATVQVLEPEHRFELDWRAPEEHASLVRFELTAHGAGTMLVLEHSRLEERPCMRYGDAWTRAADRLERLLPAVAR